MPPTISTAVVDQQALGIWFDRIKDIVQLVTVKTNPTGGGPGSPNPTLQVSVSDAAAAVQTINLSDLIQQDQYAPNGLSVDGLGNLVPHNLESFSTRYSRLKLPAFGG